MSVCIPARNHARYLAAAVESALGQDVDLEVVVHDDASDDHTAEVMRGFANEPRVRFARHNLPEGVAATRNACLRWARGAVIAWLDADDCLLPGRLAVQVRMLREHPRVGLVHAGFELVGDDERKLAPWPAPFERDTVEPAEIAFRHLLASNEVATSTVVARRSAHDAAGPFCSRLGPSSSDWDMWLRIAARAGVGYIAGPAVRYRQHQATISWATRRRGERLRCDARVVRRLMAHEPRARELAAMAKSALAAKAVLSSGEAYVSGSVPDALRTLTLAVRLAPSAGGSRWAGLLAATARRDDAERHRLSRAVLERLAACLEGTRFGERVGRAARSDPRWDAAMERAAKTVRRATPPDAVVAAVAKWDPALLALSGRCGMNFPDRRLGLDGYPRDSAAAVAHLEALRARGASHLVFPSGSFWWLDHYSGLAAHLRRCHELLWCDADCVIYGLATP